MLAKDDTSLPPRDDQCKHISIIRGIEQYPIVVDYHSANRYITTPEPQGTAFGKKTPSRSDRLTLPRRLELWS